MRQETYLREGQTSTEMGSCGSCARICESAVVRFDGFEKGWRRRGRRKASTEEGIYFRTLVGVDAGGGSVAER
jgi:ferredoxin